MRYSIYLAFLCSFQKIYFPIIHNGYFKSVIFTIIYKLKIKSIIEIKNIKFRVKIMGKNTFLIRGNICAERVRLGRALQKPPMTQNDLAIKMQLMGMEITPLIISRIEKNQRHVCDAELRMFSKALGVSMDWLCGDDNEIKL